jgi:hypothetical protein
MAGHMCVSQISSSSGTPAATQIELQQRYLASQHPAATPGPSSYGNPAQGGYTSQFGEPAPAPGGYTSQYGNPAQGGYPGQGYYPQQQAPYPGATGQPMPPHPDQPLSGGYYSQNAAAPEPANGSKS